MFLGESTMTDFLIIGKRRSNLLIRKIYQDHVQKGMEKMAAIGLCIHKILRIIYGILKHNRAFDPEVDRKNRLT
jgi:transposase